MLINGPVLILIRAFGLLKKLSIEVGSGLSEKGLKSQNIQLRTNKALDPLFAKVFGYYIYS